MDNKSIGNSLLDKAGSEYIHHSEVEKVNHKLLHEKAQSLLPYYGE
jgi:hypothetical protein